MTEIDAPADDTRMAAALRQYQAELDAGRRPDRTALLAEFPDLAGPLTEAMDGLDFLFRAAAPKLPPAQVRQLGDFRLIREVGRGGMGVVYEAEQVSLGRRVALKVLPTAAALDARQRRRFLHEAQAAAHLHHTNIVPVFAVGCDRGVDYYAMQYIDGPTLADVIQDLQGEAGIASEPGSGTGSWSGSGSRPSATKPTAPNVPSRLPGETRAALSTTIPRPGPGFFKSLARLGLQAAEALDYAHSTGVVHRDIKPANLLVDARGNLWVTDFGLALCHGGGNLTISGDVLGTLRYMSPEQARGGRGNVDHQSDVYSLGVTLYELFTLHHPYPGREREEILRQILADDPEPPRRARPDLPAELETVVMKAAAKAPAERYATAGELADDLRRFLDDKPVLARRPTLGQVAAKWARRHRGLVYAAVGALALGCVCLAVGMWLLAAEQQRTRAALGRATVNWQEARKAVDTMYTEAAEKLLTDPSLKREFLVKALAFYEQFAAEGGDDPAVRFDRAKASVRVGEIQYKLGEFRKSADAYAAALPVLEALAADQPASVEYRRELAGCLNGRAILLLSTGKPDDAAAGFRRAIAEQTEILRLAPNDRKARFDLSKHAGNLGVVLLNQGRYDEAETHFLDALRSAEAYLAATADPAPADRQHVAHTRYNAGVVFYSTDRPDLAREHWQEARRVRQELVKQFPFDPKYEEDLASTSLAMGALSYQVRRYEESEALFRDAVTRFARLLAQSPTSPDYRAEHGRGLHSLARALTALGKLTQADDALRVGQETLEKAAADFPEAVAIRLDVIRTRIDRVNLLYKAGRAAEADALAARAWSEASDGPTRLQAAPEEQYHRMILRNNMAEHAWGRGRLDEAERWFREASQIGDALTADSKVLPQHRWTYCGVLASASRLALARGQVDEADAVVRTWLAHCDRLLAGPSRRVRWQADRAWALTRLAEVREKQGRPADAAELRRAAGAALDGMDAADDAESWMAAAWFLALRPQAAERDLARARALAEKVVAKEPAAGDGWRTLGLVHLRQDRPADACVALVRAQQASGGQDRVTDVILALAYKAAGETALADQTYDQVRGKVAASGETGEELDEFRAEARRAFGR